MVLPFTNPVMVCAVKSRRRRNSFQRSWCDCPPDYGIDEIGDEGSTKGADTQAAHRWVGVVATNEAQAIPTRPETGHVELDRTLDDLVRAGITVSQLVQRVPCRATGVHRYGLAPRTHDRGLDLRVPGVGIAKRIPRILACQATD